MGDQGKALKILAPTRYPWTFNGPRQSVHQVERRNFIPFNKLSPKIEGVTVFNPWPFRRFDLIHAFNRIPVASALPYIIGFESHLPRAFGLEESGYFEFLCRSLASDRCRGIYAISEYGRRHFLKQHQGREWAGTLAAKLHVRYPNMVIPQQADSFGADSIDKINLVFIGNHFGRKGGTAVLRLVKLAEDNGLSLHIDIVSSLQIGAMSWVDPVVDRYFDKDMALVGTLPNVTVHGALPNAQVLDLLRAAHFSLLPTFSDTFGFSAIESMVNYVPVIATAQGALPEFISHGQNGYLIDIDVDDIGEWKGVARSDKASAEYAAMFDAETQRMAVSMFNILQCVSADMDGYKAMRQNARDTAQRLFSADDANAFWDDVYRRSV